MQFIAPVLKLHGDLFDVAGLFENLSLKMGCVSVAQIRIRQLSYGMSGMVIEALVEHFQHFDGGA